MVILCIGLECLEGFKGVRLGSDREYSPKTSEVINE
jgi:hypothetical protein